MSNHDKNLLWFGFQLGARLALHEAGVEDTSARQAERIELLKELRDGEISITDPEPRHTNDVLVSSSAAVLNSDRSLAGRVLEDYLAVIDETLRIADELDAEDKDK